MLRSALILMMCAGTTLTNDGQLKQPLKKVGKTEPVSAVLESIQRSVDCSVELAEHTPDGRVFVASQGVPAAPVMDGLARVLSDRQYSYVWTQLGSPSSPRYLLSRVATTEARKVADARARLEQVLARSPRYHAEPERKITANDAIPARYELVHSLRPDVRSQVIGSALTGKQVCLPLAMFNRTTLIAATGKVTAVSGRDPASRKVTFSWKDVAAGKGYVAFHRSQLPDGNYSVKLSIRSGAPVPNVDSTTGPVVDLIGYADGSWGAGGSTHESRGGPAEGARNAAPGSQIDTSTKVTIRRGLPLAKGETPLGNVLNQLAAEGKLAVAAIWPSQFQPAQKRLSADLREVAIHEAARRIAEFYDLRYRVTGDVIEFEPAPKR